MNSIDKAVAELAAAKQKLTDIVVGHLEALGYKVSLTNSESPPEPRVTRLTRQTEPLPTRCEKGHVGQFMWIATKSKPRKSGRRTRYTMARCQACLRTAAAQAARTRKKRRQDKMKSSVKPSSDNGSMNKVIRVKGPHSRGIDKLGRRNVMTPARMAALAKARATLAGMRRKEKRVPQARTGGS